MACNICDLNFAAVGISTTAKTVVGAKPAANIALRWTETLVSINSGTSTDTPAKVEIGLCTFATNPPGTSSTAITVANQRRDPARDTPQFTAAANWTLEPTVITVLATLYDPQYNGVYHYICPLSSPYIVPGTSNGAAVRVTAGTGTPSVSGKITVEE